MKKRIVRCLLCFVIIVPFVGSSLITASAADIDSDLLVFGYELAQKWLSETNSDVKDMTGDEFYYWFTKNKGNFDSSVWRALYRFQEAARNHNYPTLGGRSDFTTGLLVPSDSELEMESGAYNAALVDRQLLESLNSDVSSKYRNEIRYTTLEDIHLTTGDIISTNNISVVVRSGTSGEVVKNHGSEFSVNTTFDVYYDITRAKQDTEHVSIYSGGDLPPLIWIPRDCSVYQDGVKLKTNDFYIVLGDNTLYYTNVTYHPNGLIAFSYYNPQATTDSIVFEANHLKINNNTNSATYGQPVCERRSGKGYITSSGVNAGDINVNPYKGWVMVDLIQKFCGYYLDLNGSISDRSNLPGYVPYDTSDLVVVMIPQSGGDIYYVDPSDYTNYINNGQIIEGDYVNRYNTTTNNDIVNNYNDYVTNINNGGSGGTGSGDIVVYDDTNLLSKLDNIIVGLNNIYNTIVNFNFFNFNFSTNEGEELPVLSNQPCYDNFTDCITDHVTIVSDVLDVIDSMKPVVSDHQLTFSDMALFPVSSSDDHLWSRFNSTTIDLSWYEEYRLTIRNLLKIPCYILCITAVWAAFRQMFGVKPPGGE